MGGQEPGALYWLATAGIALASGAGGSALLELLWKPRRDRRKAATLLLAEIQLNTQLLRLQTQVRVKQPKKVPSDLIMSTLGWDTAAGSVIELPAETLKNALLLYTRYRSLNDLVALFGTIYGDMQSAKDDPKHFDRAQRQADAIIDAFNTGIDSAIDDAKRLTPNLFALAKIKPSGQAPPPNQLEERVDRFLREREERIDRMKE